MRTNPIVIGVDDSPEAATAARLGWQLAAASGAPCRLVHVTRDVASSIGTPRPAYRAAGRRAFLLGAVRTRLETTLTGAVPPDVLHGLVVREGDAPAILEAEAQAAGAEFLVLGAKRHSAVGRWLIGSTVHRLVRTSRVPVLVAVEPVTRIRRVLAAVDTSGAARSTIAAARRMADLHGAELRVLHAIEPLPIVVDPPTPQSVRDYEWLIEDELQREVWPLLDGVAASKVVRQGSAPDVITQEAEEWQADLVVVASRGKQWVDRILLGSCTERLLQHPPTSLLVVPAFGDLATALEREEAVCALGQEPT